MDQVPYEAPSDLEEAIAGFVAHYANRRYLKALSNVTPDDVLHGRREEILITRKEVKPQTLAQRKRYNELLRESQNAAISSGLSFTKVSHFCWLPTACWNPRCGRHARAQKDGIGPFVGI